MEKILIIGCGYGGQTLTGHMTTLGHQVHHYASQEHSGDLKANPLNLRGQNTNQNFDITGLLLVWLP